MKENQIIPVEVQKQLWENIDAQQNAPAPVPDKLPSCGTAIVSTRD